MPIFNRVFPPFTINSQIEWFFRLFFELIKQSIHTIIGIKFIFMNISIFKVGGAL